jgi:molybdopterin-guanine dinucleotide biosynthesis protein B
MAPIISIVGYSDAGKTTLLEKLLPELKKKGYRVGTIKNSHHVLNFDKEGKDSWRHFESGADAVMVSSVDKMVMIRRKEAKGETGNEQLRFLEKYLTDMDIIIAEGYKSAGFPKIEVFRSLEYGAPVCLNDDKLSAIVTDVALNVSVPVFGLEESTRLADFIEEKFLSSRNSEK